MENIKNMENIEYEEYEIKDLGRGFFRVGEYYVLFDEDGWHCTCRGYFFTKNCKHIDMVKNLVMKDDRQ